MFRRFIVLFIQITVNCAAFLLIFPVLWRFSNIITTKTIRGLMFQLDLLCMNLGRLFSCDNLLKVFLNTLSKIMTTLLRTLFSIIKQE